MCNSATDLKDRKKLPKIITLVNTSWRRQQCQQTAKKIMGKESLEENEYSTVCSVMQSLIIFASGKQRPKDRFDDVAIEWTSWRDMNECVCGKAFEASTAANLGTHCRRCGKIFCERCIHRRILPRKDSEQQPDSVTTPICNACYL